MKIKTTLLTGLFFQLAFSFSTALAEPITIKLEFEPNLKNGKRVYEICATCHLPEGWGNRDGTYPQLAGQHENVLVKQLLDIRSGTRTNPIMYPFVQERTVGGYQDLADVVAYISTLPMTPNHSRGPWGKGHKKYTEGKKLYEKSCQQCHGNNGQGNNANYYPRLQGQHYTYMLREANLVRKGIRKVNPTMQSVTQGLSKEQVDLIINYVSHLPVPKENLAPSILWRNPDF